MRPRAALFALTLCLSLPCAAFELGTNTLSPARGSRHLVSTASNGAGALVVWVDQRTRRSEVYAARVTEDGVSLDPEGLVVSRGSVDDDVRHGAVVASDGVDYLVVWSPWAAGTQASRVTAEGDVRILPAWNPQWRPVALAWNGQHYVYIGSSLYGSMGMLLLDRDGQPVSGVLAARDLPGAEGSIVCRGDNCLVAFSASGQAQTGVVSESMFPPPGETADASFAAPFVANRVAVGADVLGYYSVRGAGNGLLTIVGHAHDGTPQASPIRIAVQDRVVSRLQTGAAAGGIFISYTGATTVREGWSCLRVPNRLRLRRGLDATRDIIAAETLTPPAPALSSREGSLAFTRSGAIAVWADVRNPRAQWTTAQYYCARTGSTVWSRGGDLLSGSLPAEVMPRLQRGTTSMLAVWNEITDEERLYYCLLDLTGRPISPPQHLTTFSYFQDALLAFDGVNFLVMWIEDRQIRGRLIGQNLSIVRDLEPIAIGNYDIRPLQSLTWTGTSYLVTGESNVLRISASGDILAPVDDCELEHEVQVAWDPSTKRANGLAVAYENSIISAGPQLWVRYAEIELGERLSVLKEEDLRFLTPAYGVTPGVAFGGGRIFAIIHDGWSDEIRVARTQQILPYPKFRPGVRVRKLSVLWKDGVFVAAAGRVIARHATDGTLLTMQEVTPDATESVIADAGYGSVIAVTQRGDDMGTTQPSIESILVPLQIR